MPEPADWEAVRFVFRPLPDPDGVPVAVRLRRLLKYALRTCYLDCERLERTDEPPATEEPTR